MWDFLTDIANAIWTGIKGLWKMCGKIFKAVIDFVADLLSGFSEILEEIFGDDMPDSVEESRWKPFISDMDRLLANAPVSNQGLFKNKKKNFLTGVYDTKTGEIIKPTYVAGDQVDERTIKEMGEEPLIVVG